MWEDPNMNNSHYTDVVATARNAISARFVDLHMGRKVSRCSHVRSCLSSAHKLIVIGAGRWGRNILNKQERRKNKLVSARCDRKHGPNSIYFVFHHRQGHFILYLASSIFSSIRECHVRMERTASCLLGRGKDQPQISKKIANSSTAAGKDGQQENKKGIEKRQYKSYSPWDPSIHDTTITITITIITYILPVRHIILISTLHRQSNLGRLIVSQNIEPTFRCQLWPSWVRHGTGPFGLENQQEAGCFPYSVHQRTTTRCLVVAWTKQLAACVGHLIFSG